MDRLEPGQELEAQESLNAKATMLWPWESTYCRSTSSSVQWRRTPWIMLATSDEDGDFSCEWMPSDLRSTCQ